MNTVLGPITLSALILMIDRTPVRESPVAAPCAATANAAVEKWLHFLAGRWQWSDGSRRGELELRPVALGAALAGTGTGFAVGGEASWHISWDAASRRLVTTIASSNGERYHVTQEVSGSELAGPFTGTSESSDGLRPLRGVCACRQTADDAYSVVWKDFFIADQGHIDRRFTFQRKQ